MMAWIALLVRSFDFSMPSFLSTSGSPGFVGEVASKSCTCGLNSPTSTAPFSRFTWKRSNWCASEASNLAASWVTAGSEMRLAHSLRAGPPLVPLNSFCSRWS
jgi:hypothetical protein